MGLCSSRSWSFSCWGASVSPFGAPASGSSVRGLVSVAFRLVPLLVHRSSARSVPKSRLLPNRIPDDGPDLLTSCFDAPKSVLRACLALFRTN